MAQEPLQINCAKCPKSVCPTDKFMEGPENCPTQTRAEVISQAFKRYKEPANTEFAREASVSASKSVPEGDLPSPRTRSQRQTRGSTAAVQPVSSSPTRDR